MLKIKKSQKNLERLVRKALKNDGSVDSEISPKSFELEKNKSLQTQVFDAEASVLKKQMQEALETGSKRKTFRMKEIQKRVGRPLCSMQERH